jgi:murein DD-endopeptidase MepM/ murein hydrolase activator NlpD
LFLGIYLSLCAFTFFPSSQIANVVRVEFPQSLKQQIGTTLKAGDLLSIQKAAPGFRLFVHGNEFEYLSLKRNTHWVAGIGLYTGKDIPVVGLQGYAGPRLPNLTHPKLYYFKSYFPVDKPVLKNASKLRIPANVWKRVDDKHAEQKKQDKAIMRELLKQRRSATLPYCWQKPLHSKRVSKFASPRRLPNGIGYFHTGIDLRAGVGTPIVSSGPGRVVYADHMIVPGNVVVIDHGGGLYTRYMHLSAITVQVDDLVSPGQEIGKAGATGRVEGPHLHWEVVWKGEKLSPMRFLEKWDQICQG